MRLQGISRDPFSREMVNMGATEGCLVRTAPDARPTPSRPPLDWNTFAGQNNHALLVLALSTGARLTGRWDTHILVEACLIMLIGLSQCKDP